MVHAGHTLVHFGHFGVLAFHHHRARFAVSHFHVMLHFMSGHAVFLCGHHRAGMFAIGGHRHFLAVLAVFRHHWAGIAFAAAFVGRFAGRFVGSFFHRAGIAAARCRGSCCVGCGGIVSVNCDAESEKEDGCKEN